MAFGFVKEVKWDVGIGLFMGLSETLRPVKVVDVRFESTQYVGY